MASPEERAPRFHDNNSTETAEDMTQMDFDQRAMTQESMKQFKQLELLFENCQSLLSEMRDVTVQVAGNLGEAAAAAKSEPRQQLDQRLESFESRLQQERERGARKIQAVRLTCQNLVLNMAKTVKEYFKRTMEDTRRQHRKELERARREGIQEGMRRQRHLLQKNMVCTHCSLTTPRLFLCSGCWSACYCGEACQRSHWPSHMETCIGLGSTSDENRS